LEMYFLANGYVGLCRIGEDEVNVCGLFRRRKENHESPQNIINRLQGEPGSLLRRRLSSARWNQTSFSAVGGLSLRPRQAMDLREFCIGDALTMIAPVTGNGMSMAFESAELALEPLIAHMSGALSWNEARKTLALRCDAAFARRLKWSALMQFGLFISPFRQFLLPVAMRGELIWKLLFNLTR